MIISLFGTVCTISTVGVNCGSIPCSEISVPGGDCMIISLFGTVSTISLVGVLMPLELGLLWVAAFMGFLSNYNLTVGSRFYGLSQ
jgi:hypothetical protein